MSVVRPHVARPPCKPYPQPYANNNLAQSPVNNVQSCDPRVFLAEGRNIVQAAGRVVYKSALQVYCCKMMRAMGYFLRT